MVEKSAYSVLFCQSIQAGIGLPVNVDLESVVIGYSISTRFIVPSNVSRLWSQLTDPFEVYERPINKRAIETPQLSELNDYEDEQEYNVKSDKLDRKEKANNFASMRWTVYKALAEIAERCIFFLIHFSWLYFMAVI